MATKNRTRQIVGFLRDCDDMIQIISGKRIKDFVKKGIELYGEDVSTKVKEALVGKEEELPEDSPYRVLHVRADASDLIVKARYRTLVRELHPQMGLHPDEVEFARVTGAYNEIMDGRKRARGYED